MSPSFQAAATQRQRRKGFAPAQLGPGLFFRDMAGRVDPCRGRSGPIGTPLPPLVERGHGARGRALHAPPLALERPDRLAIAIQRGVVLGQPVEALGHAGDRLVRRSDFHEPIAPWGCDIDREVGTCQTRMRHRWLRLLHWHPGHPHPLALLACVSSEATTLSGEPGSVGLLGTLGSAVLGGAVPSRGATSMDPCPGALVPTADDEPKRGRTPCEPD